MTGPNKTTRERYLALFYEWCLAESRAELLRDFRTFRTVACTSAEKYVAFIQSLDVHLRAKAALALVRRYHPLALKLKGDALNDEDRAWIEAFTNFGLHKTAPGLKALPARPELSAAITQRDMLDRKRLTQEVIDRLAADIGFRPESFGSPSEWRFREQEGPFGLETFIDFGGRRPLTYCQRVSDNEGRQIYGDSSFLQWHGVTAGTSWDLLTNELISDAAQVITHLCRQFSSAFRDLVAASVSGS